MAENMVEKHPVSRTGSDDCIKLGNSSIDPYHPWDWYICLHENHKNQPNVGKLIPYMDTMGDGKCGMEFDLIEIYPPLKLT